LSFKRNTLYFETAGPSNSTLVLEAVRERLGHGDVKLVLVPSTTGKTAKLFSNELGDNAEVKAISEEAAVTACKLISQSNQGLMGRLIGSRLEEGIDIAQKRLRREAFDITFLPFCGESWSAVKEILYSFGHGMKVAMEISVVAVEIGKVDPYTRVIAVGGIEGGVDTAIIVSTSKQEEAFGNNPDKRLTVEEIIAMPIKKNLMRQASG
jgi:hypothetical protein